MFGVCVGARYRFPILYVTVRDQLLSPLVQGAVWGLGGLLLTQVRLYMSTRVKEARLEARIARSHDPAKTTGPSLLRTLGLSRR